MTLPVRLTLAPHLKRMKPPQTLEDALSITERGYASIDSPSRAQKRLRSVLRTVCKRIAEMLDLPLDAIQLDSLVEIDASLVSYVEGCGVDRQSAVQCTCDLHKLLDLAHATGWTCDRYELRKSWSPIRLALRGKANGCGVIIDFAIDRNVFPIHFAERDMKAWKQSMFDRKRSVEQAESLFRTRLRLAGLQHLIAGYCLDSKNPRKYRLKEEDLPELLPFD